MEELNLEDLNFESVQLFDEGGAAEIVKEEVNDNVNANEAEGASGEGLTKDDNNIVSDGQGDKPDQESVANKEKDNQVQTGETSEKDKGSNSSSPKLNETEQLYSNLAAQFKSEGVLPGLENIEDIKDLTALNEAIRKEVESRFSDEQKRIDEATKAGAEPTEVSEKLSTISKLESVTPEFISDEKNLNFRKQAIAQDFIDKGYNPERAQTLAQRSVDAGTDIEDADFAIKNIIAHEKKSLDNIIESAKAKEAKSLNDIKDYIQKTPEVLPGVQLTDSQKDELYKGITTDVGNKDNAFVTYQKSDPVGSRIKLEAFYYLTKGMTDFSVFTNKAETKVSNKIENLLRGANFTEGGTINTDVPDENSTFKLSDLKDLEIE
jgi:predicted nucleic acid-binding OB-fold protein